MNHFLSSFFLTLITTFSLHAETPPTPGIQSIHIIPESLQFSPNSNLKIAIHFQLQPGWHIYYKDPGDTGAPTTINLQLPPNITPDEWHWPPPKEFNEQGIHSFGYENSLTLYTTLHIPQNTPQDPLLLLANLSWVACKESCIPGQTSLSLSIPLSTTTPTPNPNWIPLLETSVNSPLPITPSFNFLPLLWAFLGGLILNLMPCVFPVLSLKIMGFIHQSHSNPQKIKLHGIFFSLGVLFSFLLLASLLIALRQAGSHIGWGFQLQSPPFILFLSFLMTAIALNFAGVFEIGLSLISIGNKFPALSNPLSESFLSGVLATVLATPCTAPFMGSALAYALTLNYPQALTIFASLALGMSLPYLLLSFYPSWLQKLPKPGPWMESLKHFLAFPMLATTLWLLWVLQSQLSPSTLIPLLFSLLLFSLSLWSYSHSSSTTKNTSKFLYYTLTLASLISSFYLAYQQLHSSPSPSSQSATSPYGPLPYETYSPERLSQLLQEGKPVYLDFTAAWCLTCQVNKKLVFSSQDVINTFQTQHITILRADWTQRSPQITDAILSYHRSGVPLNVFYPANSHTPILLPEVLTPSIVLQSLSK